MSAITFVNGSSLANQLSNLIYYYTATILLLYYYYTTTVLLLYYYYTILYYTTTTTTTAANSEFIIKRGLHTRLGGNRAAIWCTQILPVTPFSLCIHRNMSQIRTRSAIYYYLLLSLPLYPFH